MSSNVLEHARRVRREELFRDDMSQGDSKGAAEDSDDETAAARAALETYMAQSLGITLDPPTPGASPGVVPVTDGAKDDEEHEYGGEEEARKKGTAHASGSREFEFRLFASSARAAAKAVTSSAATKFGKPGAQETAIAAPEHAPAATAVVLLDDVTGDGNGTDSVLGPGGLLNSARPLSAYIAGEPTEEELSRFAQVVVRGEDVMAQAGPANRAWGWEVPWRARTAVRVPSDTLRTLLTNVLPAGRTAPADPLLAVREAVNRLPSWAAAATSQSPEFSPPPLAISQQSPPKAHRRPGKKQRIVLRRRAQALREKEAEAAAQKMSKEEHLLEKKKRLNRAKKLRRREKKRVSKTGGEVADGDGGSPDDSDGTDKSD